MSDEPAAKKSLGQHWLYDADVLESIANAADITDQDTVLEIGPGLGTLTKVLTEQAGQVLAVEFDERLAAQLPSRVPANNLSVERQDILSYDFTRLPPDYKIVANIPYYLTSNLIRVISETTNAPQTAVLLIQKEVAERVVAAPGQMSLLSVSAQFYWQVSLGLLVKAELFTPPPKVDSQVLILQRRQQPLFADVDTKLFFRLVKAGFSQRRKTLLNSLSSGLHIDKATTTELLLAAGLDPKLRPQNLSFDDWHQLYKEVFKKFKNM